MSTRSGVAYARPRPQTRRSAPQRSAPQRDHLRVAPDVRQRRRRTRVGAFALGFVTLSSVFVLLAFHVLEVQSAFTLNRVTKARTNEQLRYERLREEVARLSSPPSVIDRAGRLGMVPASGKQFLTAPSAAPQAATPDVAPQPLSPRTYGKTKPSLDQNP